jgi:hypothetical protein
VVYPIVAIRWPLNGTIRDKSHNKSIVKVFCHLGLSEPNVSEAAHRDLIADFGAHQSLLQHAL